MNNQNNGNLNKPEPKKSNKTLSIIFGILGLVIVLLIIGVGAMLASHAWNPSWNPFEQYKDKGLKEKIFKK